MTQSQKVLYAAEPIIKKLLGFSEGQIIDVENQDNDTCKHLDLQCGIDYLVYFKGLTDGLAWRAQQEHSIYGPYNSFTIRKKRESGATTEYEKRNYAIQHNALYPKYTAQAFYSRRNGALMSLAIAKTADIIECITKGLCTENKTGQQEIGQAEFYTVWWNVMKKNGYKVLDWYRS